MILIHEIHKFTKNRLEKDTTDLGCRIWWPGRHVIDLAHYDNNVPSSLCDSLSPILILFLLNYYRKYSFHFLFYFYLIDSTSSNKINKETVWRVLLQMSLILRYEVTKSQIIYIILRETYRGQRVFRMCSSVL